MAEQGAGTKCVQAGYTPGNRQMNDDEFRPAGVSPDLVRVSCGLEDARDLITDIEQALA